MPGPASHLIIIEEQTKRVVADSTTFGGPVLEALDDHEKYAALGSIGPDMIFWADWAEYTPIVNVIFDIYQTLDEIYDALNAIWQPLDDHIDKVMDSLTGGVSTELKETTDLLSGVIETAMIALITEQVPILDFLKPQMQINGSAASIASWNWLDYTHHRWTGEFTEALVRNADASNEPELRAYAYGWLSHVAADVVGHAYVNTAVGGPYRSHWQRHFIQEKFMDTWVWGFYKSGASMPASASPGTIPFQYENWTNVNGSNLHKLVDLGNDMPKPLQSLIAESLAEVYEHRPHPTVGGTIPFLKADHVNRAYQMLLQALEIMTSEERALTRPEPPSVLNDDAPPTFPVPGGGSGSSSGGSGGSFSLLALLQSILDFIKDLFNYVHDLVLWLIAQGTTPLTYPVRYALYLLQLSLYEIYRQYRWALSLSGFAYPDPDQLSHSLAQQFINPSASVGSMPRREWPPEKDHALFFPSNCAPPPGCLEQPTARSSPYTRWPINYPYWFIEGEPSDPAIEAGLSAATSPQDTTEITSGLGPGTAAALSVPAYNGSLGSAIDLYLRYAEDIANGGGGSASLSVPDWNLDADRGYGFLCWELIAPPTQPLEPPKNTGVEITYSVSDS